jgi:hypothetical protein
MTLADIVTNEINDLFDETFEQVKGIYLDRGTSLFETLATISAAEASTPISETCASIAAQVEHLRYYLEVIQRYMRGEEPDDVDWSLAWQVEAVTDEEWSDSVSRLRDEYRSVRALTATYDDWLGEDQLAGALSIIVHTAYHLGEIRQALCTVSQSRPGG